MTRTLRVEANTGQVLTAFLFPFTTEITADSNGYVLVETSPRQYEVDIEDATIFGIYRVVIEAEVDEVTSAIDSGYVLLEQADRTYVMTHHLPNYPTPSQESEAATLTDFGPKRVKTKEMEIEQFDPLRNQMASERATMNYPGWCSGFDCVGRGINEYRKPRCN